MNYIEYSNYILIWEKKYVFTIFKYTAVEINIYYWKHKKYISKKQLNPNLIRICTFRLNLNGFHYRNNNPTFSTNFTLKAIKTN